MEIKIFLNKTVKMWEVEGYFHMGKVVSVDDDGMVLDDRKTGLKYYRKECIDKIEEVKHVR